MKLDPITGPIPRAVFATLVDLPFGEAREAIRKYDPLWGRRPHGALFEWDVRFTRSVYEVGSATVKAASEEEAEALADELSEGRICWQDADCGDIEIESVTPRTGRRP